MVLTREGSYVADMLPHSMSNTSLMSSVGAPPAPLTPARPYLPLHAPTRPSAPRCAGARQCGVQSADAPRYSR